MKVLLLILSILASVIGICRDRNTSCGLWATRKYCTQGSFIQYMHNYCKLSCRLCNAPSNNCRDTLSSCSHWKNSGECVKNPGFMLKMCKWSCGKCDGEWGDWGEWSECGGGCGQGKRARERECLRGNCSGSAVEQENCDIEPCVAVIDAMASSVDRATRTARTTTTTTTTTSPLSAAATSTTTTTTKTKSKSSKTTAEETKTKSIKTATKETKTKSIKTATKAEPTTSTKSTEQREQPSTSRKQFSTQNCGRRAPYKGIPPRYRIVGGRRSGTGRWPWQVGLYRSLFSKFPFCGGTLVKPNIVLTAAHCKPTRFTIVKLGDYDLRREEHTERSVSVAKVIRHESFRLRKFQNDIALLILSDNVTLGDGINTACLPQPSTSFERCYVTGWGKMVHNGPQSTKLREIQVPLLTRHHCNLVYQGQITSRMVCAGYLSGGRGACQGDSGGPLVCENSGRFFLLGITSWGDGCGSVWKPGVYTDIRKYLHWIRENAETEIPKDLYNRPSRKYRPFILSILKLLMDSNKG